jgi:proline dehydrogenase
MTFWSLLRSARYALPRQLENAPYQPGAHSISRTIDRLSQQGYLATAGYFQSDSDAPDAVLAANLALIDHVRQPTFPFYLSVKAPPLAFDEGRLSQIARAAAEKGMTMLFDSHSPAQADSTLRLTGSLLARFPGTGCVLPARWRRSAADADHLCGSSASIRIVKGEWADDVDDPQDIASAYINLVERIAGRTAPVAVATHDPALAEQALSILVKAGTPCSLEQLRGLPRRRTTAIARALNVPVRIYLPFGPGWWPYAVDKALARPYLLKWMLSDRFVRQWTAPQFCPITGPSPGSRLS